MTLKDSLLEDIIDLQDENGCWNVLSENDNTSNKCNYYVPTYKSTLWTLILLAEMGVNPQNEKLLKPLKTVSDYFWDEKIGIYTIGKSHFPIPCLNGNMLYLHGYFNYDGNNRVEKIIKFFNKYQRFDDGGFKTPSSFPYYSNKSCYGSHSCYWGITKLFKGLSFIPIENRSGETIELMKNCIDFILLHEVCYSSHKKEEFLHTNIKKINFPNMYQSDFLEILWLLKREKVVSPKIERALEYLKSKKKNSEFWEADKITQNLIVSFNKKESKEFINKKVEEVLEFYEKN